jgi:hypothetical protein
MGTSGGAAELPALLFRLVPETADLIGRAVADVCRVVPWAAAGLPAMVPADLGAHGLSAADGVIGSQVAFECCTAYRMVYGCLHELLRQTREPAGRESRALLENCGRLIADAFTDDEVEICEPLGLLLNEDLGPALLDDLMSCTEFGDRFTLVSSGPHGPRRPVRKPDAGGTARSGRAREGMVRYFSWWDLPAYFLDKIPQSAGYLTAQFADAVKEGADEPARWLARTYGSGSRKGIIEAMAGRYLAELAEPGVLIVRFLVPAIGRVELGSAASADLVRRACTYLEAVLSVDADAGLARELASRLSDAFVRTAADVCDASDSALRHILTQRLSQARCPSV